MLIDLLSNSNIVSYNIKVAQLLGLNIAIYLAEILSINDKAIRKNKVSNDKYFVLDREYIQYRTTFSKEDQLNIDKRLEELEIIKKLSENELTINVNVLADMFMCEDDKIKANINLIAKKSRKRTKAEAIKDNLYSHIKTTVPELRTAYMEWIQAAQSRYGWLSAKAVDVAQEEIDKFTEFADGTHDLDLALKLLEIASITGYKEMQWVINKYKTDYNKEYRERQKKVEEMEKAIDFSSESY